MVMAGDGDPIAAERTVAAEGPESCLAFGMNDVVAEDDVDSEYVAAAEH